MKSLTPPFDAYKGSQPYIFISYAHRNSDVVFTHLKKLYAAGYRLWYDEGIDPGTDWSDEIAAALNGSACFLVFMSPEAVDSHNVKKEIVFAVGKRKLMVSVYIAETELPLGLEMQLGNIQGVPETAFINKDKFYAKLMSALPAETKGEPHQLPADQPEIKILQPAPKPIVSNDFEIKGNILTRYYGSAKILTIPAEVTGIGPQAFAECASLQAVIIPNGVQSIDATAFVNCVNLLSIYIPKTLIKVAYGAFTNCPKLTIKCWRDTPSHNQLRKVWTGPISFLDDEQSGKTVAQSISDAAFEEQPVGKLKKYHGMAKELRIPDSFDTVLAKAFVQHTEIEKVTIPASVKRLEFAAFEQCPNLHSIIFEGRETQIDFPNFVGCPQVVFTSLPGSATEQELAKFKTVTADPPKNVSQPEPVLLAENTQVFVPKGIASVVLKDGRQYSAIANTLLFVSWFEGHIGSMLYQGLDEKHEDRNYKHEDLIYFEDMQEFTVKLTDDDKTGYFQITDYDNQQQTKKINNPTEEIWFIDADQPSELRKVNFQALNTVKFNHGMKPDKPILMTLIQRKDQPDLAVPQAFIQFGLRDSTNVVPRGYWSTDLPLETNGKIALKRLKSITIDQVIRTPAMYQMYTEAELTIEKKNGEIIKDRLNENITMHVLTKSGLSEPLIAKMTKIIFNALDI